MILIYAFYRVEWGTFIIHPYKPYRDIYFSFSSKGQVSQYFQKFKDDDFKFLKIGRWPYSKMCKYYELAECQADFVKKKERKEMCLLESSNCVYFR